MSHCSDDLDACSFSFGSDVSSIEDLPEFTEEENERIRRANARSPAEEIDQCVERHVVRRNGPLYEAHTTYSSLGKTWPIRSFTMLLGKSYSDLIASK